MSIIFWTSKEYSYPVETPSAWPASTRLLKQRIVHCFASLVATGYKFPTNSETTYISLKLTARVCGSHAMCTPGRLPITTGTMNAG